ncbi:putative exocyst complex component Sec8 [Talaromyces proteolyticus]|uniref:Exocyst complex component Sec8 n=1 Tax=Talaromyces proteolyticus TaxID=1131652 RepID=A0AAD4KW91_9EURO|nr:putative exocyst complex component Sec8 [Talaromyces proteolyticus]KAH8702373.1 putative exocyst complex component Sec8 [Talaromyces proteolyticus]
MSGRNPYGNGYGYPSDSGRLDNGGYGSASNLSVNGYGAGSGAGGGGGRDRDRRPGGYGGFYNDESLQPPAGRSPPGSRGRDRDPDREYGRGRPDWDRPQTASSSRSRPRENTGGRRRPEGGDGEYLRPLPTSRSDGVNGARAPQSIEGGTVDILQNVQRNWDFMKTEDCIPVQVALQLMDNSTLGKADREPEFLQTQKQIQRTLKSIVNEHHQGFNSSIGTYHKIQSSIHSSQNRVRALRNSLEEAKSGLITTKPELQGLATSSQDYDDVLQLFNHIQEIQLLPEKLEQRISDKRFLAAVNILHEGLRLMRRSDFENIGALADLRSYFSNQETSLTDILIEELHDHLYLKSPYCQDRWKTPATEGDGTINGKAATWERPVHGFLANLDTSNSMVEDASRNPEADTFYYIRVIIEALNRMGNLEVAVDRIEQRLPVELFAVVDKTSAEVDTRHPNLARGLLLRDSKTGLPTEINEERGHVLTEFLWNLYAKFEAIAEGHRVVHDVIIGIVEREGLDKSGLADGFKELWKLYQSEIRSLLHDYLATDGDDSYRTAPRQAEMKRNFSLNQRDRTKKMFKMSDVDQKSSDMKTEREELDEILRSSVPGLVTKSSQKSTADGASQSNQGNSGTGHKLLIEPSVFNMGLLLPPSLTFIQRLKEIVPKESEIVMSTLTSFLDDFLVNVFQPQLDEAVTDLCALTFIAADAFAEDPNWAAVSPKPIFKGTINFMLLVKAFSKMLDSIPHDQMFTQLVLSQIVTYYDKCCGWYKALVTRVSTQLTGGMRLKASASFADVGEVHETVKKLLNGHGDKKQLIDRETELLIQETNVTPLDQYDLISDPKNVVALTLLHNSLQWLASHLSKLRFITKTSVDSSRRESKRMTHARRWTLISSLKPRRDSVSQPVYLPMNNETVIIFDNTLQSLRSLAATALLTLHIDIRCNAIHILTKTMAGASNPLGSAETSGSNNNSWHLILPNPPSAASQPVLEFNNELIAFDTNLSSYLAPNERRFITSGLARFIDQVFVSCTRYIGVMNHNGALRLQLDVLVLQQNLKNVIIDDASTNDKKSTDDQEPSEVVALPRSAKFLDWFIEGPQKALDYAKEEKELFAAQGDKALAAGNGEPFTYEELRVLVELCFSEIMRGPRAGQNREDFMAAKRSNGDAMLRLSEVMWDSK